MLRFIARRLLSIALVSLAIVFFSFLGMALIANSDDSEPGYNAVPALQTAAQQTLDFFTNLAQGDLGEAEIISGPEPVGDLLWFSYKNSLGLLLMALAGATLAGLLLGTLAALTRRRRREYTVLMLTIVGVSAPSFLLAILLQQAGIKYTQTFGRQLVSMGGYEWDFKHLVMPLLVLAARPLAYITRATYITLDRIMAEDYIRTAFSKGLPSWQVFLPHAFRNLAIPFLTAVGVSFRFALSALPLV
ncbi:MAG: ABC transporter permease, partial [Chloroflexi bacterium]|nr:ABC transporter permease [Chloroflexota bacterium]